MAISREGHVTIVANSSRSFSGFHVTTVEQIGCETTGDEPSEETSTSSEKAQAKRIADAAPVLDRAYAHYLNGKHPWTRSRAVLEPSSAATAAEFIVGDFHVFLHVKPDAPKAVVEKLPFEFVLAQTFEGGVLRNDADRATLRVRPIERWQLAGELARFDPFFPWKFPDIVATLAGSKAEIDAVVAAKDPASASVRATAIDYLLRGKPVDEVLLEKLRSLSGPDRFHTMRLLVLLSPLEPGERALLREFVDKDLQKDVTRDFMLENYSSLLQ